MARKIVVALTGGIAAYKTAELVSRLKKADCEVRVVMTKNACRVYHAAYYGDIKRLSGSG